MYKMDTKLYINTRVWTPFKQKAKSLEVINSRGPKTSLLSAHYTRRTIYTKKYIYCIHEFFHFWTVNILDFAVGISRMCQNV